ncbi:hypothetical protein PPERSA_05605 [Pseudocohnilembus persalinus]|uniref:EF-hand domain-containing protein n=1 Tax=Pseudocohnilembus persalinus TaxID=266149 RepID=A0A0V0QE07_PSEPJ|nr:hypothetical protein PPERSA_05605 [Pseudocohnilembus persalinus]|eukprot:KRX00428.1 hypothetical protein PPERSA_05605 [Pseudocohnilembus persalinus]
MGTLLAKQDKKTQSKTFLNIRSQIKKINLEDIFEVVQYIHEQYPKCYSMVFEVFDDIFGCLMLDSKPLFDRIQEYGLVDIYEALVTFVVFCGDPFESKAIFLFRLFDFDSSFNLDKEELRKTFSIVLKAVCKVVGMSFPEEDLTKILADACFNMIDVDQSGFIDFQEFKDWLDQDFQLQDFLLKYTKTNTYINGKRRMLQELQEFGKGFLEISNGERQVEKEKIKQYLQKKLADFDPQLIETLFSVLENYSKKNSLQSTNMVKKVDFLEVMKVWSAFSASDYDNENSLHVQDLKILLWIYEDSEPNQFKVTSEKNAIDYDKSGTIERVEWLEYIMQKDKSDELKSSLKKAFEKYQDKNQIISQGNLKDILYESYVVQNDLTLNQFNQEKKKQNLDKFYKEMIRNLKIKQVEQFDWFEFKNFLDEIIENNQNLFNSIIDPSNIANQINLESNSHDK